MTSEQVYVTGLRIMKEAYLIPMREKAEKMKHSTCTNLVTFTESHFS